MPYKTELTDDCLGIVRTGTGVVTGAELIAASILATQLVQNTENFQYEFVDLTEVTDLQVTPQELEEVVAQDRVTAQYRPHALVAIVAPQDEAISIAQEWERRVEDLGWSTFVCRSRPEAVQWLREHVRGLKADR